MDCGEGDISYEASSLLDSSACLASLYTTDLEEKGIAKKYYSAQGYGSFNLANGAVSKPRVYEVYVEMHGNEGAPIVDPSNPMLPKRRAVGGVCPAREIAQT